MKHTVAALAVFLLLSASAVGSDSTLPDTKRLPGIDLAEGLTQVTGVAISPLLGVSAVGAWHYYRTPEVRRPQLPWFCRPYIWGTGLCLFALCFLKDLFGTAAPPLIKKPLDFAELFESKLSALLACSAFVPFVVSQMTRYTSPSVSMGSLPDMHLACIFAVVSFDVRFLTVPLAVIAFLLVWLTCHAVNVLIAFCPFGVIDAILKLFKAFLLSSVVLSAFINPYLGAAVSLAILFVAGLLAPWAFRLTVFGTLFGLDVLLPGRARKLISTTKPQAFLARSVRHLPVRTYGRLTRGTDNSIRFAHRPWLVFPERSIALPPGNVAIARGFLFPSLVHGAEPQQRKRILIMFLPRYRSHVETIATHFEITEIQDSTIMKGLHSIRVWLSDTIQLGKTKYSEIVSPISSHGSHTP